VSASVVTEQIAQFKQDKQNTFSSFIKSLNYQ